MIWLLKLIRVFTKTRYRFHDGERQHKHGLFGTWRRGLYRRFGAVNAVAATDLAKGQPVTVGWDLSTGKDQSVQATVRVVATGADTARFVQEDRHAKAQWVNGAPISVEPPPIVEFPWYDENGAPITYRMNGRWTPPARNRLKELRPMIRCRGGR